MANASTIVRDFKLAGKNPLALTIGSVFGAVPYGTYAVAHSINEVSWANAFKAMLVLGGFVWSALKVYKFGMTLWKCKWQATGFVVLAEGAMLLKDLPVVALGALGLICAINAVANGCTMAMDEQKAVAKATKKATKSEVSGVRRMPKAA